MRMSIPNPVVCGIIYIRKIDKSLAVVHHDKLQVFGQKSQEERMVKWNRIEIKSIRTVCVIEFKEGALLPGWRFDGCVESGGGRREELGGRVLFPGIASGFKIDGEGAAAGLPLFTGRLFDPLLAS